MRYLRASLMAFILLTIITGLIYPLFITAVGRVIFPKASRGSLLFKESQVIGSSLIGQEFDDGKYLWSRVSVTKDYPYNALASGGSNLGPLNPQLVANAKIRVMKLGNNSKDGIPIDLISSSASGLDPEISIAGAYFQIPRIANYRGISQDQVRAIIDDNSAYPLFGFIGEARVNVLKVNLELDHIKYSDEAKL